MLKCLVVSLVTLALGGCAYRLPAPTPPTQDRIRVVATVPGQYVLRVQTGTVTDIPVPADGRVTVNVPAYHMPCEVYLFNEIRVGGNDDPLQRWKLLVIHDGKVVRRVSLRQVQALNADPAGYRLLDVRL